MQCVSLAACFVVSEKTTDAGSLKQVVKLRCKAGASARLRSRAGRLHRYAHNLRVGEEELAVLVSADAILLSGRSAVVKVPCPLTCRLAAREPRISVCGDRVIRLGA